MKRAHFWNRSSRLTRNIPTSIKNYNRLLKTMSWAQKCMYFSDCIFLFFLAFNLRLIADQLTYTYFLNIIIYSLWKTHSMQENDIMLKVKYYTSKWLYWIVQLIFGNIVATFESSCENPWTVSVVLRTLRYYVFSCVREKYWEIYIILNLYNKREN